MSTQKIRLGDILIAHGIVDQRQLDTALARQKEGGGSLGEHLVQLGFVTEDALVQALAERLHLPVIDLARTAVPVDIQRALTWEVVRDHHVLPVSVDGRELTLAMLDPTDAAVISDLEFRLGKTVHVVALAASQFRRALAFFETRGWGKVPLQLEPAVITRSELTLRSMLSTLVEWKGQDLHLSHGAVPAVRLDNEMRRLNLPAVSTSEVAMLVGPSLTPAQRAAFLARPELDFALQLDGVGRFRCNLYKQRGTLAFVARHVSARIPDPDELGLPPFMKEMALKRQGLVLVTGPNGHGKTTTLASLVDVINRERNANIITIEDPVEYVHTHKKSNVNQRQVGEDTQSFADGLRSVFRQNPDVIVIGEMRDYESVSIALTAAQTGHLVMASMHALNSTAAVDRILDLFPAEQQKQVRAQLAECLQVVFSQRLLRRSNGQGRVLAHERVGASLRVSNAIREGRGHQIRALMQSNFPELESLDVSLASLVARGVVARDEAMAWVEDPTYFDDMVAQKRARR